MPKNFPDRHDGCKVDGECVWPSPEDCASHDGCHVTTVMDKDSHILAREISDKIFELRGLTPHMVITKLDRIKLDPNRLIGEAACGNSNAEYAYHTYAGYLAAAKETIVAKGPGLLVDIHGQGHHQNSSELGYRIQGSDLDHGTGKMKDCSFRALGEREGLELVELLSGPTSFGALMEETGFKAVPSDRQPSPSGDKYFNGGHITDMYGSRHGGILDAVQIETPSEVRWEEGDEMRKAFAAALAETILSFMDIYYL